MTRLLECTGATLTGLALGATLRLWVPALSRAESLRGSRHATDPEDPVMTRLVRALLATLTDHAACAAIYTMRSARK